MDEERQNKINAGRKLLLKFQKKSKTYNDEERKKKIQNGRQILLKSLENKAKTVKLDVHIEELNHLNENNLTDLQHKYEVTNCCLPNLQFQSEKNVSKTLKPCQELKNTKQKRMMFAVYDRGKFG
ncbi:uncharacterized protein LOC117109832 [Anneissia japonica]|uniref:uncharacterized protein LOC117109832 n=1 Tax=Anneissia japonica TaxID=1529436 RepID=UPI00142577E8|nr:uncharacterized protein LOC117109832 [Anneissia japonica]